MIKKQAPKCGIFVCQQCSCQPKAVLPNGRKAPVKAAQNLLKDLYKAVAADPELAGNVAVRASRCQGACDKPTAFALNSATGEGWQFSGGGDRLSVADILVIAKSYLAHTLAGTRGLKTEWPPQAGPLFVVRIPSFPRAAKWVRPPKTTT